MKEKPMLFNTEMVQAILGGKKTQTRRIIKRTPSNDEPCGYGFWKDWSERDNCWYVKDYTHSAIWFTLREYISRFSRYHVGDIIYIRETWQESEYFDNNIKNKYAYRANESDAEFAEEYNVKWRPSIHMPKVAARIFLKVTDVRVERLQEITAPECIQEGISSEDVLINTHDNDFAKYAKEKFRRVWDNVYKNWNENPYVWVIEFERVGGQY